MEAGIFRSKFLVAYLQPSGTTSQAPEQGSSHKARFSQVEYFLGSPLARGEVSTCCVESLQREQRSNSTAIASIHELASSPQQNRYPELAKLYPVSYF